MTKQDNAQQLEKGAGEAAGDSERAFQGDSSREAVLEDGSVRFDNVELPTV